MPGPRFLLLLLLAACASPARESPPEGELQDRKEPPLESGQLEGSIDNYLYGTTGGVVGGAPVPGSVGEGPRKDDGKGEWFAAPVPTRTPQLGWGLIGLGGYIFSLDKENPETPPSVIGVGGAYFENDSWFAFGGGRFFLEDDLWRILAGGAAGRFNYDFFGVGTDPGDSGFSIPFRSEFVGLKAEVLRRIAKNLYLGLGWGYAKSRSEVLLGISLPPGLRPEAFDAIISAPELHLQRDTRDNNFYPTSGSLLDIFVQIHDPSVGDSFAYQVYVVDLKGYPSLDEKSVLAWRVQARFTDGAVPFYDLGQYDARGYERGRYRDRQLVGAEIEYRRHLVWRFSGTVFFNVGQVAPQLGEFTAANWLFGAGVGIRFRLTEKNPLNYRIDFAYGRNGFIVYFAVAEAF